MPQSLRPFALVVPAQPRSSHWLSLLVALFALALVGQDAARAEDEKSRKAQPESARTCRDCGIVRSIREVRTERSVSRPDVYTTSPQYLDTRPNEPPRIGPAFSLTWGPGHETQTQIGAVGSPQMQQRYIELSYEIIVRFDDGRFGLIEQQDTDGLRVGDRVQVVDKQVQRIKQ